MPQNDINELNEHESPAPPDYAGFWQNNLQKLEDMSAGIELLLGELESEYLRFTPVLEKLAKYIAVMVSIQSNFNNIEGREYFLKLNAVMDEYRRVYITDGIDFNLLHFLLKKLNESRNESFELFPWLRHNEEADDIPPAPKTSAIVHDPEQNPYKWVSFQSNGSWFLASFQNLQIAPYEQSADYAPGDAENFTVRIAGKKYRGRYIFSSFCETEPLPACFLIINDGRQVFAADRNGKRIYAQHDFATVSPFNSPINNPLIRGRVRLFGRNHLYITSD